MLSTLTRPFRHAEPAVEPTRAELLRQLDAIEAERDAELAPLLARQAEAQTRIDTIQRALETAQTDFGRTSSSIRDVNHQHTVRRDKVQAALLQMVPQEIRDAIAALERRKVALHDEIKTGERCVKVFDRPPHFEPVTMNGAAIRQRAEAIDAALAELREMAFESFDDVQLEVESVVGDLLKPVN